MQGHLPYFVMLRALYESYEYLRSGGTVAGLGERALSSDLQAVALDQAEYARRESEYLGG
jgi:hypothetical protein